MSYVKESAMRLRQPRRVGRPPRLFCSDPVAEMQLRVRYGYLWIKGTQEEEISKQWDRPRAWVQDWIEKGCPLF
jgi:hypothetical protein